jgi:hypothetical protein
MLRKLPEREYWNYADLAAGLERAQQKDSRRAA